MARLFIYIATCAFALLLADEIIPGITIDSWQTAVFAAAVLGLLNSIVKPILVLLTLPITIITLGLFIFVINVSLFGLAAWFLPGFSIAGVFPAVLGTLLVSVVSMIVSRAQKDNE